MEGGPSKGKAYEPIPFDQTKGVGASAHKGEHLGYSCREAVANFLNAVTAESAPDRALRDSNPNGGVASRLFCSPSPSAQLM
jgi:hypothetical protein